ncbi:hypothetical protein L2755_19925 [Shewanella abyssi]|uniref:hypothetical protein n=1 Tax=Shewanella abyssi TaxID=311789 RepID=UPI00200DA0D0|nr:hypothetical protein [Shewanella abyssi]MCL1051876.1 hypothetical protein [Shewanella abyssi]
MEIKNLLSIDENKPLHHNGLFWLVTLAPLLIALFMSIPLMKDYELTASQSAYDNFMSMFKLPIWVMSSSLIFGVMVTRFHSSKQRSTQMSFVIDANNFNYYLKHRESFYEMLDQKKDSNTLLKFTSYNKLYNLYFPNSSYKNPEFKVNHQNLFKKLVEETNIKSNAEKLESLGSKKLKKEKVDEDSFLQNLNINCLSLGFQIDLTSYVNGDSYKDTNVAELFELTIDDLSEILIMALHFSFDVGIVEVDDSTAFSTLWDTIDFDDSDLSKIVLKVNDGEYDFAVLNVEV